MVCKIVANGILFEINDIPFDISNLICYYNSEARRRKSTKNLAKFDINGMFIITGRSPRIKEVF
jgi:hypothetical protein